MKLLIALLLFSGIAFAAPINMDGNRLLDECSLTVQNMDSKITNLDSSQWTKVGHCFGYVAASMEAFEVARKLSIQFKDPDMGKLYPCYPEGITSGQAVRIVVKYLQEHPDELQLPASGQVLAALHFAFPCK